MIFTLSKLFTALFLPPGVFVALLFFASSQAKRFKGVFIGGGAVLWILSTSACSSWLISTLEEPFSHPTMCSVPLDAIVVLGGGRTEGAPNLPLSLESFKRLSWGVVQANHFHAPLLFSGGAYKGMTESDAAKVTAQDMGIALRVGETPLATYGIIDESKSLDTRGNVEGIRAYFTQKGKSTPRVGVVTSAYHMKRSLIIFSQAKIHAIPLATDFKCDKDSLSWLSFLPSIGALGDSYRALHEYAGIASLTLFPLK